MIDGSVLQSAQQCFEKKSRVVVKMVVRAAIRNFHLGPCKIEKSKIAKLCHNKGLPKPFIKI